MSDFVEIRCSDTDHKKNASLQGWDDGILARSYGARVLPSLLCNGCGSLRERVSPEKEALTAQPEIKAIVDRLTVLEKAIESAELKIDELEAK
jgi:hypothetical protein